MGITKDKIIAIVVSVIASFIINPFPFLAQYIFFTLPEPGSKTLYFFYFMYIKWTKGSPFPIEKAAEHLVKFQAKHLNSH